MQIAPAGLITQVKPPAQGTVPQRIASQRFVFALHVSPSAHGLFAEQPGRQSVCPLQAQSRGRQTLPVTFGLHSKSSPQLDGASLQIPQCLTVLSVHISGN